MNEWGYFERKNGGSFKEKPWLSHAHCEFHAKLLVNETMIHKYTCVLTVVQFHCCPAYEIFPL